MTAARLINRPGVLTVRIHDGTPDDYNNPTVTTTSRQVLCWYEQAQRSERTGLADQQSETHRLFLRSGENLTGWDKLTVDGLEFEVMGPPWKVINPRTQQASHIEAHGRQVV